MSMSRRIAGALTMGAIFAGSYVAASQPVQAAPITQAADDCYIPMPRGLPKPCGGPPLSNANLRDIGIVVTGCGIGAAQGGLVGCGWGAVSGLAGIFWSNVAKDE